MSANQDGILLMSMRFVCFFVFNIIFLTFGHLLRVKDSTKNTIVNKNKRIKSTKTCFLGIFIVQSSQQRISKGV